MLTTVEGIYEKGQVRLLESLPGVARARVAITVLPETLSAAAARKTSSPGLEPDTLPADITAEESDLSELGRKLLAIRQHAIARGMPLIPVDAILDEVRLGRAEADDDQNLR